MAISTQQPAPMSQLQRQAGPSGLVDVLNVLLDKGIVIDIYARVALVGIELLTVDVRIVIASVDTYLRFAEAVNRLDITQTGNAKTLPDLFGDMNEEGGRGKTKGMLEGAKDALFAGSGDDDDEKSSGDVKSESSSGKRSPARSSSSSSRSRSSGSGSGSRSGGGSGSGSGSGSRGR